MNEKEIQIISRLRKDARGSLASISSEIQMPISTVYDKISRFSKENIITKYTALVDFKKLGYHYQSKIALKVGSLDKLKLLSFLQSHPHINSIYEINGGFDYFIETIHKDIKDYINFINNLKEDYTIIELHEYQIIEEIDREKFI